MIQRVDIATPIHKAVRRILFDHALRLASTDFADEDECRATLEQTARALTLLRQHGSHEDEFVFPVLAETALSLAREASLQHEKLEVRMREIDRLIVTTRAMTQKERPEASRWLTRVFNAFVAEQLRHLEFEETEVNAALWASRSDEELLSIRARIQSRVSPEDAPVWYSLLLSSVDASERRLLGASPSPSP